MSHMCLDIGTDDDDDYDNADVAMKIAMGNMMMKNMR